MATTGSIVAQSSNGGQENFPGGNRGARGSGLGTRGSGLGARDSLPSDGHRTSDFGQPGFTTEDAEDTAAFFVLDFNREPYPVSLLPSPVSRIPTHRLTDSPIHRFTDSPIHRLTDSPTHRFTDSPIHRLTDSP